MKATRGSKRLCRRLLSGSCLTVLVMMQLLWTLPLTTHAVDKLCFRAPFDVPPTIDGVIANDQGWNFASRYNFDNGSDGPHGVVRMIRDFTNVYISFEVNNDPTFENEDVIVLMIGPDNDPTNDRRILIYPVATNVGNATAAPGGKPFLTEYWKNSNNWNTSSKLPNPIWLQNTLDDPMNPNPNAPNNIRVTSTNNMVQTKSYNVEVRLPINSDPALGINFPTSGDFKIYFNIIRVTTVNMSVEPLMALGELYWPTTATKIEGADPAFFGVSTNTPPRNEWGTATTNTTNCTGVSINSISGNSLNPTTVNVNSMNNIFSAELINSGSTAASGVQATFRSSRFGIASPGIYTPIPAVPNITAPSGNIAANGGTTTVSTGPWDVFNDLNRPSYLANPNICIQVTLTPTVAGTLINNPIGYLNMYFGTASRFEHSAVINARGFEPPPGGATVQQFDMFASSKQEVFKSDKQSPTTAVSTRGQEVSRLTRIMHVYRRTGRFIEIKGKKYRVSEPVNSYGYVLQHVGATVAKWDQALTGSGLTQVGDGVFSLNVPKDGEVTLTTRVESREVKKPKKCFQSSSLQNPFDIPGGMLILGLVVYGWTRRGRRKRDA